MKKLCLIIVCTSLGLNFVNADEKCFIARENEKILKVDGQCDKRNTPGCDFSIVLSLMAFDAGVLKNEKFPIWSFEDGYEADLNVWKSPHNPRTWILDSCVWYSGKIIDLIGIAKIQKYIDQFDFGNKDISGINNKDWPGALKISANEQAEFLRKVVNRKLFLSNRAYELTKKILFIQDLPGSWKLYGKTGVGEGKDEERTGLFIGWIEKNHRKIPFVSSVHYVKKQATFPSFEARSKAMIDLFWLINELEK